MACVIELPDLAADPIALAHRLTDRPGICVFWGAEEGNVCYLGCDPAETSFELCPQPLVPQCDELRACYGELEQRCASRNAVRQQQGAPVVPGRTSSPGQALTAWRARPSENRSMLRTSAPGQSHALEPAQKLLAAAPRWVGVLPYEAAREVERPTFSRRPDPRAVPDLVTPCWVRYGAMVRVNRRVTIVGDDACAARELARLLRRRPCAREGCTLTLAEPPEPQERHMDRIRAALELIRRGDLYQVNLARRYRLRVRGSIVAQLEMMRARAPSPYCMALELAEIRVVSTSPELFLWLDPDGIVTTAPIKGTRPRGSTPDEDRGHIAALDEDPKERAELAMVIDVERNDLGRIAVTGSVELVGHPRVVTRGSVHHREAIIRARLKPEAGRTELVRAMLPSGSVTGAPKVRAMEVIAALEPHRRGLYTGALGAVLHDGSLRLSMAIRILTVRDGVGHYSAGGGIVADSDPAREVEETRWKALQLGVAT